MKNVGRKFYHAFGGIFLLGIFIVAGRRLAFVLYAILLTGILLFDLARIRIPAFGRWAQERMATLLRPDEEEKISGSPSYILGIALALFFFRPARRHGGRSFSRLRRCRGKHSR